jgi:hypothetical protein
MPSTPCFYGWPVEQQIPDQSQCPQTGKEEFRSPSIDENKRKPPPVVKSKRTTQIQHKDFPV